MTLNATPADAAAAATLKGKVALVSGATSGIGLACAEALAGAGAFVWVTALAASEAAETAQRLAATGGRTNSAALDVTDEKQWAAVVARVERDAGALDILVNNAGDLEFCAIEDTPVEMVWRQARLNIGGAFNGINACWPLLKKSAGVILNINSTAAHHMSPRGLPYHSSKGGQLGVTRAAAAEGRAHGIRAISLHPGLTYTPGAQRVLGLDETAFRKRIAEGPAPLKRPPVPADIAAAVVFLASGAARHITGVEFNLDGGQNAR